jgi:hypothetical protein
MTPIPHQVRETRCDPERDSGKTRAVRGDPICVFFAQVLFFL